MRSQSKGPVSGRIVVLASRRGPRCWLRHHRVLPRSACVTQSETGVCTAKKRRDACEERGLTCLPACLGCGQLSSHNPGFVLAVAKRCRRPYLDIFSIPQSCIPSPIHPIHPPPLRLAQRPVVLTHPIHCIATLHYTALHSTTHCSPDDSAA